jgi:hypothetical protein
MASVLITAGALLLANYSPFVNFQFFDQYSSFYLYKNSLKEIKYCSFDDWTFLSDLDINCEDLIPSLPNIDNPHVFLAIQRTEEIFLIPKFHSICYQILNNETVLSIGTGIGTTDNENCSPSIFLTSPLQFDPFLLTRWQSFLPIFTELNLTDTSHSSLICASLEYGLLHNNPSSDFASDLGSGSVNYLTIFSSFKYNRYSWNFWMNLCNLDSKVIALHQQSIHSKEFPESYCLLKKVSGPLHLPNSLQSHQSSILCLEDLFPFLSSPESPVIFLSPIGLDMVHPTHSVPSSSSSNQQYVSDINAIILARQNLNQTTAIPSLLCVHSALRGVVKYLIKEPSLTSKNHAIHDILLTLLTTTNPLLWRQSFSSFTFEMKDWLDSAVFDNLILPADRHLHRIWNLKNKFLLIQSFDDILAKLSSPFSSPRPEIIFSDPVSRYLLGETLDRYSSYLTFHNSIPSSSLHPPSTSHNYFHHFGQYLMHQPSSLLDDEHADVCLSHEIISYDLSDFSVVSTTSHILIFVKSSELFQARNLLQKWRSECQYCPLVMQFVIYVLDEGERTQTPTGIEEEVSTSTNMDTTLDVMTSSRHEYRLVLLTLHDYLVQIVVNPDIVIVLVGLHSMKSFIAPGGNGLLPLPKIGDVSYVRLFASLVFSSNHYLPLDQTLFCSEINFNSFVGTAPQILHFLTTVLYSSNHRGSSDAFLRYASLEYVRQFQETHRIRIDSKYQLFDYLLRSSQQSFLPNESLLKPRISDYRSTILRAFRDFSTAKDYVVSVAP